jgi:hypothetical protein
MRGVRYHGQRYLVTGTPRRVGVGRELHDGRYDVVVDGADPRLGHAERKEGGRRSIVSADGYLVGWSAQKLGDTLAAVGGVGSVERREIGRAGKSDDSSERERRRRRRQRGLPG